jgi:hypothetical protein
MDTGIKKTRKGCRPEFETTRTCELLSRLAEEAEEALSAAESNSDGPDPDVEKSGETDGGSSRPHS